MSNNQNFNNQTDQRVSDAKAAGVGKADNIASRGIPGAIGTSQGGDGLSPAGATKQSLGAAFQKHGSLYASLPLERTIQGNQSLESLTYEQKTTRIGGGGLYMGPNGVGNVNMSLPSQVIEEGLAFQINSITGISYTGTSGSFATALNYPYNPSIDFVATSVIDYSGELHSLTGTSYTGSGYMPVLLSGTPVTTITSVTGTVYGTYAALKTSGVNYSGSGTIVVDFSALPISGVTITYLMNQAGGNVYPRKTVDPSGAGWSQSGNNVLIWNGTYTGFSGANTAGKIPASGQDFYPIYANGNTAFPFTGLDITNGQGWTQSGNYILFTNNSVASYYFALSSGKIPNSGDNFYVNYTSNDIINPTGVGTNGAGWYLSGTDLRITNGSYTSFATAASAGTIPNSGENFYTFYSYTQTTAGSTSNVSSGSNYTMPDNQGHTNTYIPNVGNRFSR